MATNIITTISTTTVMVGLFRRVVMAKRYPALETYPLTRKYLDNLNNKSIVQHESKGLANSVNLRQRVRHEY